MSSQSVIDGWREKVLAHDREATAIRTGHGPSHGQEHGGHEQEFADGHGSHVHVHGGHGGFSCSNLPHDPHRTDDPAANMLFGLLTSDATVLDVGGGPGRFALPLATRAKHVTVVEPSAEAIEMLHERAGEAGLSNITSINERWEDAKAPTAALVLCSLVLHHVPEAAQFITKLEAHATDHVVVVEMMAPPSEVEMPFYERVYVSTPTQMPGLPDFLQLLWAMDIYPDVTMLAPEPTLLGRDRDTVVNNFRRRLGVEEGTHADLRLLAAADELLEDTPRGFVVKGLPPRRTGIVTWRPAQRNE